MQLAEDSIEPVTWGRRLLRVALVLAVMALVGAAAWWLKGLAGADPAPQRQVARISILPDTPPPPPPPPPKEVPPPPKEAPRPAPQAEAPKPAEAPPAEAPIKMEGPAGDGPSVFAAGPVRNDYIGGPAGSGGGASAPASAVDRAQERLYASTARQLLRDALEQHLKSGRTQATAEFTLWLERDGSIRRTQLVPTGDGQLDGELTTALDATQRELRLPPPPTALQPLRFRLTVRPQG